MIKKNFFTIGQLLTLISLMAMEFTPNKYLENGFVLIKTFATLQATILSALILGLKARLPSPSTVNMCLEITKPRKPGLFATSRRLFWTTVPVVITICSLLFGQWTIFISFLVFLICMGTMRSAAENYLKYVKVDTDKKSAVIDV